MMQASGKSNCFAVSSAFEMMPVPPIRWNICRAIKFFQHFVRRFHAFLSATQTPFLVTYFESFKSFHR